MTVTSSHSDRASHTESSTIFVDRPTTGSTKDLESGWTTDVPIPEIDEPRGPDADEVTWDGPSDPENPRKWPFQQKFVIVAIVSAITFISPLASSIFAPAIDQIMKEFKSNSPELASFIVSVYVIGYCFGPLLIAPLSEIYGRSPLYHICNVLFVIFSVACALAPNLGALIAFRFLAGLGASCPMAIGAGTIADVTAPEIRGKVMAAWLYGPIFGPIVGAIAGGYLAQAAGWRWTLWLTVIAGGIVTLLSFVFLRESYAPTILEKKTAKLRKSTGNPKLRSSLSSGLEPKQVFAMAIFRPTKMLVFSPIVLLLSLQMLVVYGYLYLVFTAIPTLFEHKYGFSSGNTGLAYIGLGLGASIGLVITGAMSDRIVTRLATKNGGERKPEYRIPLIMAAALILPIGLFWFGWTGQTHQHWILPMIGLFFIGLGMTPVIMSATTYLVDAYTQYAASAVAASTVVRSLGGAFLPLAGRPMFNALDLGWGASLLAFIALAMVPVPAVFYRYGERIRNKRLFGVKF
ncbi:hypothetical protein PWT90_03064 [Aphanocladium album]|nr:hypothetical protein PWT90_03064 [Aphanocladium album]